MLFLAILKQSPLFGPMLAGGSGGGDGRFSGMSGTPWSDWAGALLMSEACRLLSIARLGHLIIFSDMRTERGLGDMERLGFSGDFSQA